MILCLCSVLSLGGYEELMDWPQSNLNLKDSSTMQSRPLQGNIDEEIDGVRSNERWAYVKVNMDGVTIGRKICVLDHGGYSSLARQLEDMFGEHPSVNFLARNYLLLFCK